MGGDWNFVESENDRILLREDNASWGKESPRQNAAFAKRIRVLVARTASTWVTRNSKASKPSSRVRAERALEFSARK